MPPEPADPQFRARVRASFSRQGLMTHLGARLLAVEPGFCEIELPRRPELTQQHGYVHAGAVVSVADTAAGYAALSLMPAGHEVLTVELKINLLTPAAGDRLLARGRVRRAGRTLSVVEAEVLAVTGDRAAPVALMLATMIGRPLAAADLSPESS